MTHPAFLVALCEHGDGAGPCFPDHAPEVGHGARQGPLGGDELVGTEVSLETHREESLFS